MNNIHKENELIIKVGELKAINKELMKRNVELTKINKELLEKNNGPDKYIFEEDEKAFTDIKDRYEKLQETNGAGAFELMKKAMSLYDRFSYIRYTIRRDASRGQYAALKERLNDKCKYLDEIHRDIRVTWKLCREDSRKEGY